MNKEDYQDLLSLVIHTRENEDLDAPEEIRMVELQEKLQKHLKHI